MAADYYKNEELLIENAIPTAEGALAIAMEELPITIFGSKVLVTGYGRVAKTAAKTFSALGASVTVAARKYSDLAWAGFDGCKTEHISNLSSAVKGKDIIINSVPSVIFDKSVLKNTKGLIIDLASKPGGVDFEAAKELGSRVVWALSLPGKNRSGYRGIYYSSNNYEYFYRNKCEKSFPHRLFETLRHYMMAAISASPKPFQIES